MQVGRVLLLATLTVILPAGSAAASSHTVTLTTPLDGATVSGIVTVEAVTSGPVASVRFEWATSAAGPWTLIDSMTSEPWTTSWDTGLYDGPAILRAAASDGTTEVVDSIEVEVDNAAEVSVQVAPGVFSPNGDGHKDTTSIEAETDRDGGMDILVLNSSGVVKRSWHRTALAGEPEFVTWNGKSDGKVVGDGTYRVRVESGGGHAQEPVVVDTKAPTFHWRSITPEPLSGQTSVHFGFTSHDRAPVLDLKLTVRDRVRVVGTEQAQVAPGKRSIAWKARYPGGGALYPGLYTGTIKVHDDAGNVRTSKPRPWRVNRQVAAHVYHRVDGAGPRVALTFDDCHHAGAWGRILDILKARHLKASFFCPGQMMQVNAGLLKRTVKQGHTVGSHAWDHALLTGHSVSYTAGRLAGDARVAWQIARTTTWPYFRPPYGAYDHNVLVAASATAHPRVILWDVDPQDWATPGVGAIVSRVVSHARAGSIVVLHTLDQTAAALPGILKGLAAKGLHPVDLPHLFKAGGFH